MLEALLSFAISFLAKLALGWIEDSKKTFGEREIGRLRSELEHALDALRRQQAMAEIAARLSTRADVLQRLGEGGA